MKRRLKKGSENMKYNLRKKHSLFELLSTQIKIFISICTLAIVFCTGYIFRENLLIIWEFLIRIISNTETYVFISQFVLIPISLVGLVYFAVDYGISVIRNRYIPLDKDELKANNIHSYDDYNEFLMRFLRGYYPLRKLRTDIKHSAQKYLGKSYELKKMNLYPFPKIEYEAYFQMYWKRTCPQRKKKMTLLYIIVGLLGIGIFFCFIPIICSVTKLNILEIFTTALMIGLVIFLLFKI